MTYTQEEQDRMNLGSTINGAIERQGGYYQVGNCPFPQAISTEHAVKLYHENFTYNGEPIKFMTKSIYFFCNVHTCVKTYDPHTIASYVWG